MSNNLLIVSSEPSFLDPIQILTNPCKVHRHFRAGSTRPFCPASLRRVCVLGTRIEYLSLSCLKLFISANGKCAALYTKNICTMHYLSTYLHTGETLLRCRAPRIFRTLENHFSILWQCLAKYYHQPIFSRRVYIANNMLKVSWNWRII